MRARSVFNSPTVVAVLGLFMILAAGQIRAQPDIWRLPPDTVASWIFSPDERWEEAPPSPLAPSIRLALGAGLIPDDDARLAAKILAGFAAVGEHPHRIVFRDFRARPASPQGGMEILDLEAVLEIRTSRTHFPLVGTIESLLVPAAGVGVVQRQIDLPMRSGQPRAGVELVRDDLPAWARVSWVSEPGLFTIAVGQEGTLARWLAWRDAPGPRTPEGVRSLRSGMQPDAGERTLEFWADLNAIRRGFPLAFDSSRLERVLIALGVINARELALVAHELDREGRHSLTWAVDGRADPPGRWQRYVLTQGRSPDRLPGSTYALRFGFDLIELERFCVRVYQAALKPRSIVGFGIQRERWLAQHGRALGRLSRSLGAAAVLADVPPSPLRFPGFATIAIPLRENTPADAARRDLNSLLDGLASELRYDLQNGIWSIGLVPPDADPAGLLRLGAIGIAGEPPALFVSWSPSALQEAAKAWSSQAESSREESR